MPSPSLEARRVLVVGSNGGIGAATVAALVEEGARVCSADRDIGLDVTKPEGANVIVERALDELGGLDGVVHAVGMSGRDLGDGPPSRCSDEAWAAVMNVNLASALRLVRATWPHLREGSSLVFVGSVLARTTDPNFLTAAYAASKGGLISLVRATAREGAPRGIRANLVSPGLVDTPMASRALRTDQQLAERLPQLQPLGGCALAPEEVADGITWLLSSRSAAATGIDLVLDRGWSLR